MYEVFQMCYNYIIIKFFKCVVNLVFVDSCDKENEITDEEIQKILNTKSSHDWIVTKVICIILVVRLEFVI